MSPTTVAGGVPAGQTLEVSPFERVELRDPVNRVHLIAAPGERHTVAAEGAPETLRRVRAEVTDGILRITVAGSVADHLRDAVTTSLSRQELVYRVHAPRLREVRVAGYVSVAVDAFGADAPVVTRLEPQAPAPPRPPR
jgi:hypothetical protein